LLIKAGIDITLKDGAGETALHKGNFKIEKKILKR
jgi:hypothetical protein